MSDPMIYLVTRAEQVPRPLSVDDAWQWLSTLNGQTVTVDVETSGYPVGHPHYRLRTIQLGTEAWALVLDADHPLCLGLAGVCLAGAAEVVAHSPTADLVPLEHAGVVDGSIWGKTTDTAVQAALAPPEHRTSTDDALGLKPLSAVNLSGYAVAPAADKARKARFTAGKWLTNTSADTPPERSGWAQVPAGDPAMTVYAASDVLDTAALHRVLPTPLPALAARERALLAVTARVARRGLLLDPAHLRDVQAAQMAERDAAATELAARFGIREPSRTQVLGQALLDLGADLPTTPTGKPSTRAEVVEALASGGGDDLVAEACQVLLRWRKATKLLSAFLDPWLLQVDRGDGRLRSTIYTLGAVATGRMSSARVNLQQVPRTGGIRGCVVADPGTVFVSADFSSVEVRVAAALSQDPTLMHLVATGGDLHAEVARQTWGAGWTKAQRYQAKRAVFGRLYGSGVPGISRSLGITLSEAQRIVDGLDATTPVLSRWSADLSLAVKQRRRLWHDLPSGRRVWFDTDRTFAAGNYSIQSEARELMADALLRWDAGPWAGSTVLPIHDELLVQVPEADAQAATDHLLACMTTTLHGVTIAAEASQPSRRWADST